MSVKFHGLAASALFLTLAGCNLAGPNSEDSAAKATAENRWRDAASLLAMETAAHPADETLALRRVQTLLELGEGEAAKSAIEAFAVAAPDKAGSSQWRYLRAEADARRGKPHLTLDLLAGDVSAEAGRVTAIALLMQGKYDEAEQLLLAAHAQDATDLRITSDLALLLVANGKVEMARPLVATLAKDGSEALGALMARGKFLAADQKPAEALTLFEKARKLYPDSRTPDLARLHLLADTGKFDEAEQLALHLRGTGLNTSEVIVIQAGIAASRDDWQRVRDILQASEKAIRDNPEAQLLYGLALRKDGQDVTAMTLMRRSLMRNPDYLPLRMTLAEIYLEEGQRDEAARLLAPVRSQDGLPPATAQMIARVFGTDATGTS